jgi:hypothetical protein
VLICAVKQLFICLAAFSLVGCDKPKYEFHSSADGQIIWCCNRETGQISVLKTNTPVDPVLADLSARVDKLENQLSLSQVNLDLMRDELVNLKQTSPYELHESKDTTPILLNKDTGETSRYFRNHDTNGQPTDEGFIELEHYHFVPTPKTFSPDEVQPPNTNSFSLDEAVGHTNKLDLRPVPDFDTLKPVTNSP